MSDDRLRDGPHLGHLLHDALTRNADDPVLHINGQVITGREMAERISTYVQAMEATGAGSGTAVGLLAANRPEVLLVIGAGQTQGYRRTALHPLGSLDDHAYVLADAGIETLRWKARAFRSLTRVIMRTDSPPRPPFRCAGAEDTDP